MESTGRAGQVQLSQETAKELAKSGYEDWCWPRKDVVYAKGKGELQTFWLDLFDKFDPLPANALSDSSNIIKEKTETDEDTTECIALDEENERLISWVVERLSQLLKKIVSSKLRKDDHSHASRKRGIHCKFSSLLQLI
jgi:hypothetical protein